MRHKDLFSPLTIIVILLLVVFPLFANSFWLVQIGAQTFVYGLIALGLTLLAGYGGMVSLAQMTVAGISGYMAAIFGVSSVGLSLGLSWPVTVLIAIIIAIIFGILVGVLSIRTKGIYTIMITIAIATGVFYFTRQNYTIFNGFNGFSGIKAPIINGFNMRDPINFYYLCLVIAMSSYFAITYLVRSTFGLSLQGVRDNFLRMEAIGFNAKAHQIYAYAIASTVAAIAGILLIWMNGRIDPSTIGTGPTFDILIIAVIGGLGHPIGAFVGALIFTLLDNFAIDFFDKERFNTLIGTVFLLIVIFSPDGVVGWWRRFFNKSD